MKDRISLYPGRVELTPVPGQTNVYDMIRADEPQEVGTPLNKATLLKDDVAMLLGLDPKNATPNDVFEILLNEITTIRNTSVKVVYGAYTGGKSSISLNFGFAANYVVIRESNSDRYWGFALRGEKLACQPGNFDYANTLTTSWTNTGMTFTTDIGSIYQLGYSGKTYKYIAIG